MLNYESFVARHSEFYAQALIENQERYKGIRAGLGASLEERWNAVMREWPDPRPCMASA